MACPELSCSTFLHVPVSHVLYSFGGLQLTKTAVNQQRPSSACLLSVPTAAAVMIGAWTFATSRVVDVVSAFSKARAASKKQK